MFMPNSKDSIKRPRGDGVGFSVQGLLPRRNAARTKAARKNHAAMSASVRRGWAPKSKRNPGEDNGSEEKPCGNESMCEARLGSPKSKGEPRRGQRQRRKAHGNECKCVAKLGS